ncbi:MAG TPA: DUF4233 domain-containing protein [Tessaracoccus flavescens]|uniref:DUF4233 domain-containing protein n=1 Tax=Tessaracoccus flavescens TaxID=399497 RepID=A0A921ENV6_9ACTN|nr:DUF4233 domain-containing protein [Tessaracoccus flavescens]
MTLDPKNPMRSAVMSTLIFEIIIVWLAFIGMIQVSGVNLGVAAVWCAVVSVLCLIAVAGLRKGWGYYVGWLAQIVMVGLGFLTPWMFAMGVIFALIWVTCIILGRRIETRTGRQES